MTSQARTARWVCVRRRDSGQVLLQRVFWCASFLCQLRGLTFRRSLGSGEGLLLVQARDSRLNAAIHMLFVHFALGVVWLDSGGRVVDTCLARPWRLLYLPRGPARYVLEAAPSILDQIVPGDELEWVAVVR